MKILILDAYSAAHIGNGVLYQSSCAYLKKIYPDSEINVLAFRKESLDKIKIREVNLHKNTIVDEAPVGRGILSKVLWTLKNSVFMFVQTLNLYTFKVKPSKLSFNKERKESLKLIEESDIIVSITGEQINDAFSKTLLIFVFMYGLAIKMNKKMIFFPQSIGPLNKKWTKKVMQIIFNKSFLVMARDEFSINELKKIGVKEQKYVYVPDIGITQKYDNEINSWKALNKYNIYKKKKIIIALTLSDVHFIEDGLYKKKYLDILYNSLCKLKNKEMIQLLLMPANFNLDGSIATDYDVCKKFYKKLQTYFEVNIIPLKIYSPYEFKGIQGCMDLVISTRMHASILSTMAEVPTITINTQRKLRGYMNNINMDEYSVDIKDLNEDMFSELIEKTLNSLNDIKKTLVKEKKKLLTEVCIIDELLGFN